MSLSLRLEIGEWSIDTDRDTAAEVLDVETFAGLGSVQPACRVTVYSPPRSGGIPPLPASIPSPPGAEPAATTIRGIRIEPGDPITVEFGADGRTHLVTTAVVDEIRSSLGAVSVVGRNQLQRLAACRLSAAYQGQTTRTIVEDLGRRAGLRTGEIETGATHPWIVIHESRSALRQLLDLAALEGMDVFDAPDGALTVKSFENVGVDHRLRYGADLLGINVEASGAPDEIAVYAESPASRDGAERWYVLAHDGEPFSATAGDGPRWLAVQGAAVRTKGVAESLAAGLQARSRSRRRDGGASLLGRPDLKLGETIEIVEAPRAELNGVFRILTVRHRYSRRDGFVTDIRFGSAGEHVA